MSGLTRQGSTSTLTRSGTRRSMSTDSMGSNNMMTPRASTMKSQETNLELILEKQTDSACGAAARNDMKQMKTLSNEGHDFDQGNYDGRTPLHIAATKGLLPMVELLIERLDASKLVVDNWGGTALDDAIRCKHKDVEKYLKGKQAPIGKRSSFTDDATLLCDAGSLGDRDRLQSLVKGKADINQGDYDTRTALHLAASEGKLAAVKFMIEKLKADQNVKDRWGGTPMDDAIRGGHEKVYTYLEKRGAMRGRAAIVSDDNATDLCSAASSGDMPAVRKLVAKGADIDQGDYDLRTAMHLASSEGLLLVVKCLREEFKADVNVKDRWGGTPLDDALRGQHTAVVEYLRSKGGQRGKTGVYASDGEVLCRAAAMGDMDMITDLVDQGVSINCHNYDGRTALHMAAAAGKLNNVTDLIIKFKADRNVSDKWGSTPLDNAARAGHEAIAGYLESIGGSFGRSKMGASRAQIISWTLLEAAATGDTNSLRRFSGQGVNINVGNYDKRTALHLAAANNHLKAARCLVEELNAELNLMDSSGRTPLDEAVRFEAEDVLDYLQSKGALKRSDYFKKESEPVPIKQIEEEPEFNHLGLQCCCNRENTKGTDVVGLEFGFETDPVVFPSVHKIMAY